MLKIIYNSMIKSELNYEIFYGVTVIITTWKVYIAQRYIIKTMHGKITITIQENFTVKAALKEYGNYIT